MLKNTKIQVFEEVLYHLNSWYKEKNPEKENDISILKAMKLLFFVSGADVENNLFDVFNKFQAWQYGHVESDIYNFYSRNNGKFFSIELDRNTLRIKENYTPKNGEYSEKIRTNIERIKEINSDLISYDAFHLVDISHSHLSWDIYYNKLNRRYEDMEKEMLKYEPKYYR
ncbi:type II toxin-antitoxin system antitoxin SocA domain-containing protein [Bergeyella zoohelcum]|uniref:Antitoxin SocA-like Panacea domain-containing protein n=1 Tax=Bergeyella zoohelcum ATCC 43767 TaxID=883096 RepID=K1MTM1_9FLAO|nr:type II toxin-antitoxin system antitoxin SocA domain-containing protein [Bergeyella zoohelcum]EKB59439.1 hypothetical protein HMPREF9699_00375 [Bergeyella zoohelcum ATCC 43767]SUV49449.1 Uncharacterized phage-associated protein [Bergeyella zoohelcum]